ncbi:alpha/beta hydrolase [Marinitenerispora sediminis]|uniref:Alpha/beta hydrolase n=1 Tax=Marinitenerispora sediminis TaxID=1931232 RepID=A0A368T3F7_9ACTN|nr:alpha/beta hydrolase [Marinitenerispora sediminis]RCV52169.1 alpha/beta hydrolase [Marinitenerispora sediminis]RCV52834.1 alpha/beta hydrolase [Marinitenerispora sediminis]RCV57084.1 alpha/beta hydrolase [Marinitenerispora sediminis]
MSGGIAVTVAGALLAALAPAGTAAAAAPAAVLDWSSCTDLRVPAGEEVECATLEVPLDHDAGPASQATARIALSRVPARGQRTGVLLVNPGGPGSPGREWAAATARRLPDDLRERYDVVGFDPRGTGASTPAVACDPGHFAPVRPDTVPRGRAEARVLLDRAASYARACRSGSGELLEHMTTVDSARDMDAVRAALGVERIDFLGYSYGSYLGGVYATLFPRRVDRLVLDSVVDPDTPWYAANLAQSRALDAAADNFFAWIARHDAVYRLGGTGEQVRRRYFEVRARLAEHPLEGRFGPTELENTYVTAAYDSAYWPALAAALAGYASGEDPAALLEAGAAYGESAETDPTYGAYLATECTDSAWPRDPAVWRRDGRAAHAEAPFQGWNNTWYNAPCMFWPAAHGDWFQIDGSRAAGALLVQASEDGPTPLAGAHSMLRRFPAARLVVEEGGVSHGVSLRGNACVDEAVVQYLRDGSLPEAAAATGTADLSCATRPEPRPRTAQTGPPPADLPLPLGP